MRCKEQPNQPAAGKAGIASLFAIERLCPGLPGPGRWGDKMKTLFAIGLMVACGGCADLQGPFVQNGIRIVPPVKQDGSGTGSHTFTLNIFNDGGTRWIKITDAECNKFDVYVDHRIETRTPNALYLFAYPGKSNSLRVVNQREFKRKIHFDE